MVEENTFEAQDWFRDLIIDAQLDEQIIDVSFGDGAELLDPEDTTLSNELHRISTNQHSTITITNTANPGEISVVFDVTGGTEVPAGTDVREFGLFARDPTIRTNDVTDSDDLMLYRELINGVSLPSGVRKTIQFDFDIDDAGKSSDAVLTNDGQDWIISKALGESAFQDERADTLAIGSLEKEKTITFSNTQDVYSIEEAMRDDGIINVVDASGDEYIEDTDYAESDADSDNSDDSIDWSLGGNTPDDGEDFTVTYEIENTISESDSSLNNQVYSATVSASNVSIEKTSNVGQFRASISVTGGVQVETGERISEFGIFTSDGTLLYKEVFEPVTVDTETTQTFTAARPTVVRE